jgi:hypothetical protein
VRPQGFAAWWPHELRSQFGDTGINAELNYKMAWSQPVFQFTLENRLELSPLYVATREPVNLPASAGSDDRATKAASPAPKAARAARSAATAP